MRKQTERTPTTQHPPAKQKAPNHETVTLKRVKCSLVLYAISLLHKGLDKVFLTFVLKVHLHFPICFLYLSIISLTPGKKLLIDWLLYLDICFNSFILTNPTVLSSVLKNNASSPVTVLYKHCILH